MKERPIIFNAEMVRAILDGRKSQERRPVARQPLDTNIDTIPILGSWGMEWDGERSLGAVRNPFGQVGDRLWVKETWTPSPYHPATDDGPAYFYRADYKPMSDVAIKWKPSIHMPRCASRITLEITGVRVERLQNISEEEAIAEGIESAKLPGEDTFSSRWKDYQAKYIKSGFDSPIKSFASLWDSMYSEKYPWESNPWVWVIEFERVEGSHE